MATATPAFSFFFILRPQSITQGMRASTKSVAAEYARNHQQSHTERKGYPTANEIHNVQVNAHRPTCSLHGRIPQYTRVFAADEQENGNENVEEVHGDKNEPEQGFDPTLGADSEQSDDKGGLAHSARHDNQRLGNLAEKSYGDGILRYLRHHPLDVSP